MNRRFPGLGRRILSTLVLLALVVSTCFIVQRSLPGDPIRMILGPQASAADIEKARELYRLDGSLMGQFGAYLRQLLHGDLGTSHVLRAPVTELIAKKAPASAILAIAALWLQVCLGLTVGCFAALKRGHWLDRGLIGLLLVGVSLPTFVSGLGLQYVLSHRLGWLPLDGYGSSFGEFVRHLILPTLTLGLYGAAIYARLCREQMIHVLQAPFITAARARGASTARVVIRHGMRAALAPIVTLMVLELGALIGGAIVTEKIFRWPGLGNMAVDAMVNRDGPLIMGTVLVAATAMLIATLLADGVTAWLNPKSRQGPTGQI